MGARRVGLARRAFGVRLRAYSHIVCPRLDDGLAMGSLLRKEKLFNTNKRIATPRANRLTHEGPEPMFNRFVTALSSHDPASTLQSFLTSRWPTDAQSSVGRIASKSRSCPGI